MRYETLVPRYDRGKILVHVFETNGREGLRIQTSLVGPGGKGIETGPQTIAILRKLTLETACAICDLVREKQGSSPEDIMAALRIAFDFLEAA